MNAAGIVPLVAGCDWLALATIGETGSPASSYAPFALVDTAFVIAVSRLAAHARNLAARPDASLLLIGAPSPEGDAFARPRLSVDVQARLAARGSSLSHAVWRALHDRFGATVSTLRDLPDFETLLLEPQRGRLILGFAAARDLDAPSLQEALRSAQRVR